MSLTGLSLPALLEELAAPREVPGAGSALAVALATAAAVVQMAARDRSGNAQYWAFFLHGSVLTHSPAGTKSVRLALSAWRARATGNCLKRTAVEQYWRGQGLAGMERITFTVDDEHAEAGDAPAKQQGR